MLIALCLLFSASTMAIAPAVAQPVATGTLTGVVRDPAGKPLGGARVTVTSAAGTRTVVSGNDGKFTLAVPPDTYSVSVSATGFESQRNDGVTVTAGSPANVVFSLAQATLETIGRTATTNRATSINTSTAAIDSVSSQTFVDQGQNQIVNVLDQIPGVEIFRSSSGAPGANTSISIRGAQPYESQVLIDGHPVVTGAGGAYGFNSTFVNALLLSDVQVEKGPGAFPNTIEDAIGGTINLETPSITGGPTGTALLGYDSFNGSYYAIRASDTFGKLGLLFGIAQNATPGYLPPNDKLLVAGSISPAVEPGTAYEPRLAAITGFINATEGFDSRSQLFKVSYDFSPTTSIMLTQYTTQTYDDETGVLPEYNTAVVTGCLDSSPPKGLVGSPNCTGADGKPGSPNFTAPGFTNLIGKTVQAFNYDAYGQEPQADDEPIYSAEFRTNAGPGSFLGRFYTGALSRVQTQQSDPDPITSCATIACPLLPNYANDGNGEPYVEDEQDVLQGFDGQYTVPFGANFITAGFDHHQDRTTVCEGNTDAANFSFDCTVQGLVIQSDTYSIRGDFQLAPKLTLSSGNYFSATSYVGHRFDPRDGLVYKVNPNAAVRFSYGTAFVAPFPSYIKTEDTVTGTGTGTTLNEITANKPETSSGYDLGTDFNVGPDTLVKTDGYITNLYNRFASDTIELATPILYNGTKIYDIAQDYNTANSKEEGIEFQVLHAPRVGFGAHGALDLLRDYSFNQTYTAAQKTSLTGVVSPANYVQLPGYEYSKIRGDIFYNWKSGDQIRFSSTSYGANNSYGEPGFTAFDGQIRLKLQHEFYLNIGGTNLFNHDNDRVSSINYGGQTYQTLSGGVSASDLYFFQPRTFYLQLQRSVGPGGSSDLPRASL